MGDVVLFRKEFDYCKQFDDGLCHRVSWPHECLCIPERPARRDVESGEIDLEEWYAQTTDQ